MKTITKSQLRQMIKEAVLKEQFSKTVTNADGSPLKPLSQHQVEEGDAYQAARNIVDMFEMGDFEPEGSGPAFRQKYKSPKEENIAALKEEIAVLVKFVKAYEAGF